MNNFIYDIPTRVYFGTDALDHLGEEAKKYGKKVLLTYGGGSIKRNGIYDKAVKELEDAGLTIFELSGIEPNPRIDTVRKGVALIKENDIDFLLAIGGGSTIDASKIMAAGACVDFDPWLFLTEGREIKEAKPLLSILTLSATGSEMDGGAVISNPETNEKLGGGGYLTRPKVSFLNPEFTYTVSKFQTAAGSADIFSHLCEIYFDRDVMPMLSREIEGLMKTVIEYSQKALANPDDYEARANLMWTSSWAINGFLGATSSSSRSCHPMEHELSAYYDITHGLGLAILTPRWMEYILDDENLEKFYEYGVNVFGIDKNLDKEEVAKKAIEETASFLYEGLGLDSKLSDIGIDETHFDEMAEGACKASSGDKISGYKDLFPEDVKKIYQMCL